MVSLQTPTPYPTLPPGPIDLPPDWQATLDVACINSLIVGIILLLLIIFIIKPHEWDY
jgi:hypothetical protein